MARLDPSSLPEPTDETGYVAGSFVESDRYDVPQGSQSSQPSRDYSEAEAAPPAGVTLYQDVDDPAFAILTGTQPLPGQTSVAPISHNEFEHDDDFVVVPQGDSDGS